MVDQPNSLLLTYLEDNLTKLGLDSETYGPYVMGCLTNNDSDDNNDQGNTEDLDEIIELLRASSETHSDDESSWENFKTEVLKLHIDFVSKLREKKNEERLELKRVEEAKRQQEIELAKQHEMESQKLQTGPKEMSEAKKALLEQYAYDTSELYDNDGKLINDSNGASGKQGDEDINNREVAKKISMEKAQGLRQSQTSSKQEERIKTKNAKLDKIKQKEERRKRATKGERRR